MKKLFTYLCLSLFLISCGQNSAFDYKIADQEKATSVKIHADSIRIKGDLGSFTVDRKVTEEVEGVQLITFTFSSEKAAELQPITLEFNFPSVDVNGYWNPSMNVDKVNYWNSAYSSKASRYAPVFALYNNALQNRITYALSDALNIAEISSYIREEDVNFYPRIRLFKEKMPKTSHYEVTLRIDTRPLAYYETINDVASWWANNPRYKPMFVPDGAKKPMYSTWYSYHQSITAEEIVAECKIAKELGCEAVIVDDGWQTKDGNRGYAFTGDWNPDRIPDMKGFVDAVHAEGMQFILWYSLPFMGEKAKNYPRFKGKYLSYWDSQGTYVMDPRYPEVREYIVNTYIKAMQDWNLDGFKLDFIGRFTADKDTKLTKANGRDYASVNEATDALMTEVTNKLTELKPDILIEFRQPYIGPLMRKYGNMFRGVDAPNNAVANKIETTNLRILSQNTAVHSDMFIWRSEENVENAALQILNILYSVPQLSVRLKEIPDKHLSMIKYWFAYWNANRHILLDGKFMPSNPGANYPILTAVNDHKQITTVYEDMTVSLESDISEFDIVNAKASTEITLLLNQAIKGEMIVLDCEGNIVIEKKIKLTKGINLLKAPASGMIHFKAH